MSQFHRRPLWAGLMGSVLAGALLLGASQAAAQSLKEQIVGTWKFVSIYNETNGVRRNLFEPSPVGILMFDRAGNFSAIVVSSGLPKFASKNREKGTADENRAVVQGSIAWFGTYTVGADGQVSLKVEGSTYPNRTGTIETRTYTISGDEMKEVIPTPAIGSGTSYLTWKRAK